MKYKMLIWIFALNLPWTLVQADHDQGFYVGGGLELIGSDSLVSPLATRDNINLPALEILAGYKYNGWLGLELRYGLGIGERDLSTSTVGESLEYSIDNYQSIYFRPEITNEEAKFYFLLGYSKINAIESFLIDETLNAETDYSASGLSYGLGAGWFLDDHFNINIEYRALLDDDETEFNVTTLILDYRFKNKNLKFW